MIDTILWIFLITLIPTLELRASIPYGIIAGEFHWFWVFLSAIIANIILAVFVWWFITNIMHHFLKINRINQVYKKLVLRSQTKLKPYIDKYGLLGLALFIGIPLPGSGVYSGGLGAYFLGYNFKNYFKASILGVLIAATIVTIVVLTSNSGLSLFIKSI